MELGNFSVNMVKLGFMRPESLEECRIVCWWQLSFSLQVSKLEWLPTKNRNDEVSILKSKLIVVCSNVVCSYIVFQMSFFISRLCKRCLLERRSCKTGLFGGLFIRIVCVISANFICSFVYIKGYFAKKERGYNRHRSIHINSNGEWDQDFVDD